MWSWKLPYFNYNEFPILCLSVGSQRPNTWWMSAFQLLNPSLGSLTFLHSLLLHWDLVDFIHPCSLVIYSEIHDPYLAKFTTHCWKGAPYFFPPFLFLVISHLYSLGTHQCNFLGLFFNFLSCNIVISHWYTDVSNRAYQNATKVCWLFYLIYIITLYTYHSYSIGI